MSYIDTKYIGLMSVRLGKFAKKKIGLYNFRCPYCGDSKNSKNKARGYLYQVKSDYNFKCHNCGVCKSFSNFLKEQDTVLYDEYVMERYKNGITGKGTVTPNPKFDFKKPEFKKKVPSFLDELDTIYSLNTSHPAKEYLLSRKIEEENLKELYFCPKFKEWTNKHAKVFDNTNLDEPRIIIPLKDSDGNLFGFQGRSLDLKSKLRYITIMLDETIPKVFGLDKVNQKEKVYVTEGPFDSLFLKNSIAMCGADVSLESFNFSDIVYVLDNEPRNFEIVKRISSLIERGKKVVIFPNDVKEKDLNEMVVNGKNPQSIVESNVYTGLEAKLKLLEWKKV